MRRLLAVTAAGLWIICLACGSGSKSGSAALAKQPTDPKTVPTATLPAVLPSPLPAGTVSEGTVTGQANTVPTSYTVKQGDTMAAIAQQLGVPLPLLVSFNPDANPSNLRIGEELKVPPAAGSPTATASAGGTAARTATPPSGSTAARSVTPSSSSTATRTTTPSSSSAGALTTASPSATRTSTPSAGGQTYTVQSGDTACKIAGNLHVSLSDLASANGTTPASMGNLTVGQQLKVPSTSSASPGC
jgi:LysM repeat protein